MKAEYISHFGSDLDVVNDAKVSFAKASTEVGDKEIALINYLARGIPSKEFESLIAELANETSRARVKTIVNDLTKQATHWVPFAHNGIKLRMSAPIPIRVHCFKHKIGFVESEESRRYITNIPELHIPKEFHLRPDNIKQGSSDLVSEHSDYYIKRYKHSCTRAIKLYEEMIKVGIAPEEARYILPQGVIVNWRWTGNLAAFARYYNQRSDAHAQKDDNILAEQVKNIIEPLFPYSWKALTYNN
jgi:thymidylate synthase (FAD)